MVFLQSITIILEIRRGMLNSEKVNGYFLADDGKKSLHPHSVVSLSNLLRAGLSNFWLLYTCLGFFMIDTTIEPL